MWSAIQLIDRSEVFAIWRATPRPMEPAPTIPTETCWEKAGFKAESMGSGIDFWQFVGGLRRENVGENLGRSPRVWRKYQNFKTEDVFLVDLGFLIV